MEVIKTDLPGVLLIKPRVFGDARGYFVETWSAERYREVGIKHSFVQDNLSRSAKGVLRGLHFQNPHSQGKLVRVAAGEVFDVAVDVRRGSPHFGKWVGALLTADSQHQLWVPPGFAHGFCVVSDYALFEYKCTDSYHPEADWGLRWNDPGVGIEWPITSPTVSEKDASQPLLSEIPKERLPPFAP